MIPFLMIECSYMHIYVWALGRGLERCSRAIISGYPQGIGIGQTTEGLSLCTSYCLHFFPAAVHPFCTIFVILKTVKINKRKKN